MIRRSLPVRLALLAAALATAACDRPLPTTPVRPDPVPALAQELVCQATVASGRVACTSSQPTAAGGARAMILGGQDSYVQLASSGASYDGSAVFSVDVTVRNLIAQTLGTRDGTTADAAGVRVFFATGPTATGGTGVVSVANADGTDLFTASGQPYFQYAGMLRRDSTSAPRSWRFTVPSTVTSFSFRVYVAAAVQYPDGWVSITPGIVDVGVGTKRALSVAVRDALGRPLPSGPVTWGSATPSRATVDSAGVVTGLAPGGAVITARVGGLTGSNTINVVIGGDTQPPQVRALTLSATSVDVSTTAQQVRVLITARDAWIGVRVVHTILDSHDGSVALPCASPTLIGGTVFSGTWRCTVTIPRGSRPGTWHVRMAEAVDSIGNRGLLSGYQLQTLGFATTVEVTSAQADSLAPAVTSFSALPGSVDVTGADAAVEVRLGAADGGVGVKEVYAILDAPGVAVSRSCGSPTLVEGTIAAGTWRCSLTLPRGSAGGSWTFREIGAVDSLGNRHELSTAEMQAAGYATILAVTSAGPDVTAPAVTGFSFSPDSVYVTNAPATVEVRVSAADGGVGVREVYATLYADGAVISQVCASPALVSGTAASGTWGCTVTIPRASASGPWTFREVGAVDHVGNAVELRIEDMQARGFPFTVQVRN